MPKTSPMSPFYEGIYTALVPLSHSVSSDNNNRLVVYDTISNFIQCSAKDTSLLGEQVAGVMAARQRELIGVQSQLVGHDDFHNWNEMQVGIAVVLKAFINKSPAAAVAHCNDIMTNLLEIMNSSAKSGGILEEMFDTVGAIASALEGGFAMYLSAFVPYLRNALSLFNEYNVLLAALGCIDDLRAVGEALTPEAPGIMEALAKVLCEPSVSARVKPLAVTAIGNVAFAIGGHFTPYLGDTMTTLGQAGSIVPSADMDPDFVWQMRESIVQAVTEILGGLSGSNEAAFGQYVGPFLGFLQTCFADEQCTEEFVTGALGLIGDMAKTFKGSDLRGLFTQDWVKGAIAKGRVRGATKLSRGNAAYAQKWIDEM
jgi:importin subunit beta-1